MENIQNKCIGKDRYGNSCRNYPETDKRFCKRSHAYMEDYTTEQMEQLTLCKGCIKWKYMINTGQCDSCSDRGKVNREKAKAEIIVCKSDGCKFKKSKLNDYCGQHQLCLFVDECHSEGLRPCRKYTSGCRAKLAADYKFTTCEECLEVERKQDKERRSKVDPNVIVDNKKQCTICRTWNLLEEYERKKDSINESKSNLTLLCLKCRNTNAKYDRCRDKEHRNELDKIASKKPERKAVKKAWKENNYENVALTWLNYRDRQYSENQDEYLKNNAETMAKWRERNLEKVQEANINNLLNIKKHLYNYKHRCELQEIHMELTEETFKNIVKHPCYYCNTIQDKGFNGIDRMDSTRGYILENCVSCCDECNTMKGSLDVITFIKRAEHILTYNNLIANGVLHPETFSNHKYIDYQNYIRSAKIRGYCFELTEDDFYNIISQNCYICGKENNDGHRNGIDRYNNTIGYTIKNVKPCCCQCNIMKNNLKHEHLLQKLLIIYENCKNKNTIQINNAIINSMSRNSNKLSKDERQKNARERKQKSREAKRLAAGNEEYLKERAKAIAEYRKQKKNNAELIIDNNV